MDGLKLSNGVGGGIDEGRLVGIGGEGLVSAEVFRQNVFNRLMPRVQQSRLPLVGVVEIDKTLMSQGCAWWGATGSWKRKRGG